MPRAVTFFSWLTACRSAENQPGRGESLSRASSQFTRTGVFLLPKGQTNLMSEYL